MKLLLKGVNPEPWRAPTLGTKRIGTRVFPVAFKDENLRDYQNALHECAEVALGELGVSLPVFPAKTELAVSFAFYRQLDRYRADSGRSAARKAADATNLLKAAEDALQGVIYHNDRYNRHVSSTLTESTEFTEPMLLVIADPYLDAFGHQLDYLAKALLSGNGVPDKSMTVWAEL